MYIYIYIRIIIISMHGNKRWLYHHYLPLPPGDPSLDHFFRGSTGHQYHWSGLQWCWPHGGHDPGLLGAAGWGMDGTICEYMGVSHIII